jgi:peptidoglycan/xylan/chitin deacetylase (PgdA/CDA1 family)
MLSGSTLIGQLAFRHGGWWMLLDRGHRRAASFIFIPRFHKGIILLMHLRPFMVVSCLLLCMCFPAGVAQAAQAIPILVYHRFAPSNPSLTTMTLPAFEQQLDWLDAHHYQIVPLQSVTVWLGGDAPALAAPCAVITVDDGNISVFTQLYPIILQRHLHVTLFIYPSVISNTSYALTWEQLAQMQKSGLVDVQSHTYWHPNFRVDQARRTPADYSAFVDFQLSGSKAVLQNRLGVQVEMLAWPYGIFDPQLEAAAKRAGYHDAFAFAGGSACPGDDLFAIPRIPISGFIRADTFASLMVQPCPVRPH